MTAGTYLLVKFKDKEQLVPAVRNLDQSSQITKWEALDGHFDLLLKLKQHDQGLIEKIRGLDGFHALSSCDIVTDNEKNFAPDTEFTYSYILVETDKDHRQDILQALSGLDAVSFASPVSGDFDLLALLKTENFDKADRIIDETIRDIDGLLRLKRERIISLDSM